MLDSVSAAWGTQLFGFVDCQQGDLDYLFCVVIAIMRMEVLKVSVLRVI